MTTIYKAMHETRLKHAISQKVLGMRQGTTELCLLNCDRVKLLITRHDHKHQIEAVEAERQAFKIRADWLGIIEIEDNEGYLADIAFKLKMGNIRPRIRKLKADIPYTSIYDPELKKVATRIQNWNGNVGALSNLFEWTKSSAD